MALTSDASPQDSPVLPQPPAPRRPRGGGPLFQAPVMPQQEAEPLPPSPSPSEPPTSQSLDELPVASPSDSGWPTEPGSGRSDDDPTSSATSTQSEHVEPSPLSKRAIRRMVRGGVIAAGSVAHEHLAADELEQALGVYLFEEEEVQQIATPLGNIAARRSGAAGAIANPDVADAISAAVGFAVYLSRQLALRSRIRKARSTARLEGGEAQHIPTDQL